MIKVYHFPSDMFKYVPHFNSADQAQFALIGFPKFHLVAEVSTDSLADAFHLTNSIEAHWSVNQSVKALLVSRSTSVGDVLEQDGKFFVVASFGFVEIFPNQEVAA